MLHHSMFAFLHRALGMELRSRRHYWLRMGMVLLFLACIPGLHVGAPGLEFLDSLTKLNLLIITLSSVMFVGTIIEEKEEGTLDLLQAAGVGAFALVFGKWSSSLTRALLFLLIQIPFAMLALPLGGTTPDMVLRAYVVLAGYLTVIASLCTFLSVICRTRTLALGCLILVLLSTSFLRTGPYREQLPDSRLRSTLKTPDDVIFDMHLGVDLGLAGLFFILAWLAFRSLRGAGLVGPIEAIGRRTRKPRRTWRRPVLWKEFWFSLGGLWGLALRALVYGGLATYIVSEHSRLEYAFASMVTTGLVALYIECAFLAVRLFHKEYRDGTLETLALVPMETRDIVLQKFQAAAVTLVPVFIFICSSSFLSSEQVSSMVPCTEIPRAIFYGMVVAAFAIRLGWYAVLIAVPISVLSVVVFSIPATVLTVATSGVWPETAAMFAVFWHVVTLVILVLLTAQIVISRFRLVRGERWRGRIDP